MMMTTVYQELIFVIKYVIYNSKFAEVSVMECDFCKIANKEKTDVYLICDSENAVAFLDYVPINEGHILVVPKLHESTIDNIPMSVLTEIFEIIQKIVVAYKKVYNIDSYSIMQNGGECCDYGHAHFHVFPRYNNDGFGWTYPEGPFEYSNSVAEKIRKALQ